MSEDDKIAIFLVYIPKKEINSLIKNILPIYYLIFLVLAWTLDFQIKILNSY